MFTQSPTTLTDLKGNNYNDPYVKLMLENQLKNCANSFKNHQGITFAHLYANGIKEYKEPTFSASFEHSQLSYPFKICEITHLFANKNNEHCNMCQSCHWRYPHSG